MADYWGGETGTGAGAVDAPMSNGGAVQPAANNGGEAVMEDDGKQSNTEQQDAKQSLWKVPGCNGVFKLAETLGSSSSPEYPDHRKR
jgi:hypothetical protein